MPIFKSFLPLFFTVFGLWISPFLPASLAQANMDRDLPLLQVLSGLDQHVQWLPMTMPWHEPVRSKKKYDDGYNLFVSGHAPEADLLDMDGHLLHRWQYPTSALPGDKRFMVDFWMRARLLPDGDLLAMVPHGGLLKLDRDSRLVWFKKIVCHHDFDLGAGGDIYTLTIKSAKSDQNQDITVDSIVILSSQGQIKKEISLYGLFQRYPDPSYIRRIQALERQRGIFYTQNGSPISLSPPGDAFHANSIQVLDGRQAAKVPAFQKGNILVSLHHLGLLIVVDPGQEKIVWLMDTKFWEQGQNDARLLENGHILLFDNHYTPQSSRVVEFDPSVPQFLWAYDGGKAPFHSVIAGECQRLPNGNTLIVDSTQGHAFEVTVQGQIVWEYYNPHQTNVPRKQIAMVFQMQRLPLHPSLNWLKTDAFLDIIAKANQEAQWEPFVGQQDMTPAQADPAQEQSLISLSYLQAYVPTDKRKNVVFYDKKDAYPGYNLMVSSHAPEALLLDMNGAIAHRWQYPCRSLPMDQRYCAGYWDRVRLLKNGGLLAMLPYGGMLKMDKDSRLIWFKAMLCHHDLDLDGSGNIYTLTVKNAKPEDPLGMKIDAVTVLSPDGVIQKEISLYDLFKKYPNPSYLDEIDRLSGAQGPLTAVSGAKFNIFIPGDVFHGNAIQVLDGRSSSLDPAFQKGNVLISIRHLGLIIVVDPRQEKIVKVMDKAFWSQGQHFAKMLENGHILLFDNFFKDRLSRVVEFDPFSNAMVWDYADDNGPFFSSIIGQSYRLPNGNTLITESTRGHAFEVTPRKKIVWDFYNPNQIDVNSRPWPAYIQIRRAQTTNILIAVLYQMQRIPLNSDLDWLVKTPTETSP